MANVSTMPPHERRTIAVEAWAKDLDWIHVAWQIDGWNVTDALITAPS